MAEEGNSSGWGLRVTSGGREVTEEGGVPPCRPTQPRRIYAPDPMTSTRKEEAPDGEEGPASFADSHSLELRRLRVGMDEDEGSGFDRMKWFKAAEGFSPGIFPT